MGKVTETVELRLFPIGHTGHVYQSSTGMSLIDCRLIVGIHRQFAGMKRPHERVLRAFGQAVRLRRRELGLSQEKLVELADLHRTYVADIERGTRNVGLVNIVRLADALGVTVGSLFEGIASRR